MTTRRLCLSAGCLDRCDETGYCWRCGGDTPPGPLPRKPAPAPPDRRRRPEPRSFDASAVVGRPARTPKPRPVSAEVDPPPVRMRQERPPEPPERIGPSLTYAELERLLGGPRGNATYLELEQLLGRPEPTGYRNAG